MKCRSAVFYKTRFWFMSLALIATLVFTSTVQSYFTPLPYETKSFETVSLPPESLLWTVELDSKAQVAKNSKLDSVMAELAAAADISRQTALNLAKSKSIRLSDNRVQVQIVTDAPRLEKAIQTVISVGGEVTSTSNDATVIQGWLPVNSLETIASDDNVDFIRRPAEVILLEDIKVGSLTTEGVTAINGSNWHAAGYTGTGVKIGIIDGGFLGYNSLLGTDLPSSVTVKNFVDGELDNQVDGDSEHGTACAEVIHDIAPDASLYLAKVATNLDLQQAVNWLKTTHQVDVISTSLGWYNLTPGDGTGEFADLVQDARDAGILWTTAASNDREAHWGGPYYDPGDSGYHYYNDTQNVDFFGPGDGSGFTIPAGYLFRVYLRWDDWTNVDQDYDLYLLGWNGSSWVEIGSSIDSQDGSPGQTPTEYASVLTTASYSLYGFGIQRYSGDRTVNLEVFAPKIARLDEVQYARSLSNLADSPDAMTVAALDVTAPYPQESYSSEGPTNGPGGTELGGFNKPDIAGFANVSTVSYGTSDKFNGTSSATPHVAGAAALVLSAYPSYSPDQIQTYLEGHAVDMGTSGVDTIYGYGRLYLGDPPSGGIVLSNISPNSGVNTGISHVTITGSNFANGAAVKLTRSGESDILATNVNISGTTSITCDFNLSGASLGSWNVIITNPDLSSGQLTNGFTVTDGITNVFVPLVLNNFPAIPTTPTLNTVNNADGDGNFTVSWTVSENANSYLLQEDDNTSFSSPTTVYTGSALTKAVTGKDIGTYYYRVKASNPYAESEWSNTKSVVVTVPPPDCPQLGVWSGTTNQGRQISFEVENTTACQIKQETLSISKYDSCYITSTTTFFSSYPITNNHFATGITNSSVIGDFTSSTTANGTFYFSALNPYEPWKTCTVSGTWSATP